MKTDVPRHDMQFKRSAVLGELKETKAIQRISIAFFLLMISACDFRAPQYYSKVIMEVKPNEDAGTLSKWPKKPVPVGNRVKPTDFSSKEILYPVINNLKLADAWSQQNGGQKMSIEQAYGRLVDSMEILEVRNTDLIEIRVHSADRFEAANTANMIAVVYQQKRKNDLRTQIDHALADLQLEIDRQRKVVEVAREEVQRIRTERGISDSNPEASGDGNSGLQVQARKDEIATLGDKAKGNPNDDQADRRKLADYLGAKNNYIVAKHILDAAERRLATQKIQIQMALVPAKIWEIAEPAPSPSKRGFWFQDWHR